jgi:hypothetical protein
MIGIRYAVLIQTEVSMTQDSLWNIHEKAKKRLLNECRVQSLHPVMRKVYEANDWSLSLKCCIEGLVQGLDSVCKLSTSLTEAIDKDAFVENLKETINDLLTLSYELSQEYSFIKTKMYKPLTTNAKKKIDLELEHYWKTLETMLETAKKEIRALKGKTIMVELWDDERVKPFHKFFDRVLSMDIQDIQKRFEDGETIFGDDMEDLDDLL